MLDADLAVDGLGAGRRDVGVLAGRAAYRVAIFEKFPAPYRLPGEVRRPARSRASCPTRQTLTGPASGTGPRPVRRHHAPAGSAIDVRPSTTRPTPP